MGKRKAVYGVESKDPERPAHTVLLLRLALVLLKHNMNTLNEWVEPSIENSLEIDFIVKL